MPLIPTLDIGQLGLVGVIVAALKLFFSWVGKTTTFLLNKLLAFWIAHKFLGTAAFFFLVYWLVSLCGRLILFLFSSLVTVVVGQESYASLQSAFQLIALYLPIADVVDFIGWCLSLLGICLLCMKQAVIFSRLSLLVRSLMRAWKT